MRIPRPSVPGPSSRGLLAALAVAPLLALSAAASPSMPLKGIVLWPDQARAHPELNDVISLEFVYATPSSVVPGANPDGSPRYDWTSLERTLDDIASRGHQAILRFRYEYPGEKVPEYPGVRGATGVPAFLKALPDYKEGFQPNPNGDGPTWYADWSHPKLLEFTERFYRDFAARYDSDPRVAFLEFGFGHWAEYHTCGTEERLGVNFPTLEFQARMLRLLDGSLRATPWAISIDAASKERSEAASDPELRALGFGLFDDSFMHARHDLSQKSGGYNEKGWLAFGADRWRRAPCGGEISYYTRRDQREFLSPRGLYGITWEQAAAKYHMTFVIGNDSLDGRYATPERLREAAGACGYDFRLVRVEQKDGGLVAVVANDGVAPLYHDAYLSLDGFRSAESLRGLQPGETRDFTLPAPASSAATPSGDTAPPTNEVISDDGAFSRLRIVSDKLLPGAEIPLRKGQ